MSFEPGSLKSTSRGNVMKRNRKAKAQDNSQTAYTKILDSLRSAVSGDYSKVIQKEKRAVVLAYD
jgi:hypothetical protein